MAVYLSISLIAIVLASPEWSSQQLSGQNFHSRQIRDAAEAGKQFLLRRQQGDGSFPADGVMTHRPGVTSLALLALLETGMDQRSPQIQRAAGYLRSLAVDSPQTTHEIAMVIMGLISLRDQQDLQRITQLTRRLEARQADEGGWRSLPDESPIEPGLTHLAILALRDAMRAGIPVSLDRWSRAGSYWRRIQNADGSWGLKITDVARTDERINLYSATLSASSSLAICNQMVAMQGRISARGEVDCCRSIEPDKALQRGRVWLETQVKAAANEVRPWLFMSFRLSGLEQANRTSSLIFPAEQDWYSHGLLALLQRQNATTGHWEGNNDVVATSHSLLFLSRELAPVLINKLVHGIRAPISESQESPGAIDQTSHDALDVGSLVAMVSERPRWPRLMSSQEIEFDTSDSRLALQRLQDAPILYVTGPTFPQFTDRELLLIKQYLDDGGILFASPACETQVFERDFRKFVGRLTSDPDPIKRLPPDHPLFWSEFVLDSRDITLYGVETGCRTSIIYSPDDLGCLWSLWTRFVPDPRSTELQSRIQRAVEIGANVCAYATSREPLNRFDIRRSNSELNTFPTAKGRMMSIAEVVLPGTARSAPHALSHLLRTVNRTTGLLTSTHSHSLELTDRDIYRHPLLYLHGSNRFTCTKAEIRALRTYLERGGVLFADACCGSPSFDVSFRALAEQIATSASLQRIPNRHEIFSEQIGHDIKQVRLQTSRSSRGNVDNILPTVKFDEPCLEGIEIDGRFAVIYSKYDLSCALDRPGGSHCDGYATEDAIRIATNIVLYSLLQEQRFPAAR